MSWLIALILCQSGSLFDHLAEEVEAGKKPALDFAAIGLAAAGHEENLGQAQVRLASLLTPELKGKAVDLTDPKAARKWVAALEGRLREHAAEEFDPLSANRGRYSAVTVTFLLVAAAPHLPANHWQGLSRKADEQLLAQKDASAVLAALLCQAAHGAKKDNPFRAASLLRLSLALAPEKPWLGDQLDIHFYNASLELFQANRIQEAGALASAAFRRFPQRQEFLPICFNAGVALMQAAKEGGDIEGALDTCERLAPLTGEHRSNFEGGITHLLCLRADQLRIAGQWERGMEFAAKAASRDPECNVDILLAEAMLRMGFGDDAKQATLWQILKSRAPQRAEQLDMWLRQNKLVQTLAEGNLEEALTLAEKDVNTSRGLDNYLSVLTTWVRAKQEAGAHDQAFERLAMLPTAATEHALVSSLRLDTYFHALHYAGKDRPRLLAIYERLFADSALAPTTRQKRQIFEDYGLLVCEEMQALISAEKYDQAHELGKRGLAAVPGHPTLTAELARSRKILDRLK